MPEKDIYRELQKHLDKLPIGFPVTESGVELRILKFLFTPEEAEIALNMRFVPEPPKNIYRRLKRKYTSQEELENKLKDMYQKGAINVKYIRSDSNEEKWYHLAFLAVGMYEYQVKSITPQFYNDIEIYFKEAYVDEFVSTKINQLRTIPVEMSIEPEHRIATYDVLKELIEKAEKIAVMDCICQKGKELIGKPCKQTNFREHCFTFNSSAQHIVNIKNGRFISKEEAFDLMKKAQEEGLILQPGNAINPNFICCCCGDCCDLLTNLKKLDKPWELIVSNYFAQIDEDLCVGCETCINRCQMNAISLRENVANIKSNLCIGCGNCVVVCPEKAISLIQKENEIIPPETTEDLYLKIMNKRAKLRRFEKGNV